METTDSAKTNIVLKFFTAILAVCLIFPSVSTAELKPMSEGELKTIALNDFIRPVNVMILQSDIEESYELEDTDTVVVSGAEAPILIDGEKLIEDLMAQYESIQSGNGPIEGIYPDPSYLLKQ
ncbi:MAG: hypothetical protein JRF40_02115 [Deltaproteobacteria bacterium]|nr:hypothetical protein [Deltaproteobacteria bacterium]MBW2218278.1 hypothetical protein [Deltaproteobacteria bacterium]